MFQTWRQKIREAEAAYRNGQLEEAGSMLQQDNLRAFRPGRKLAVKVAAGMAERAHNRALLGDTAAGWNDLHAAVALQSDNEKVRSVRETLLAKGLAEVERYLSAGDITLALDRLALLAARHPPTASARLLRRVAGHLQAARAAERKGHFEEALDRIQAAATLRPDLDWFPQCQQACNLKAAKHAVLNAKLREAFAACDWSTVVASADRLLLISPENAMALSARCRAWDALQPRRANFKERGAVDDALGKRTVENIERKHRGQTNVDDRLILWIDAVGGFLVCLRDEIVLGRPAEAPGVDIPILADLSRRHAVVRRDGESYLLEALRATKVDGRVVRGVTSLTDGSVIELAGAVELRFRRPHPLSATARLEIISGHKTVPHLDAVLLMAESCVLGPAWQNHVVCRPWQRDVVLYRQQNQLHCRSKTPLSVAGQVQAGGLRLRPGTRVDGEDLAFSVESAS